jgi:hypothetical protein
MKLYHVVSRVEEPRDNDNIDKGIMISQERSVGLHATVELERIQYNSTRSLSEVY